MTVIFVVYCNDEPQSPAYSDGAEALAYAKQMNNPENTENLFHVRSHAPDEEVEDEDGKQVHIDGDWLFVI